MDRVEKYLVDLGKRPPAGTARPILGIHGGNKSELPPAAAAALKAVTLKGIFVGIVKPGSVAEAAGIKVGDDLVEFDGKPVASGKDLAEALSAVQFNVDVPVSVLRDGVPTKLNVRFARP